MAKKAIFDLNLEGISCPECLAIITEKELKKLEQEEKEFKRKVRQKKQLQ